VHSEVETDIKVGRGKEITSDTYLVENIRGKELKQLRKN
jgi:hypothetical protein